MLEDKIIQRGVVKILSAIYEQDFLDTSYGFREKRSGHDALKAVELSIMKGGVNYLLDMDIRGYYDHIDRRWLMKMLKERIVDRTILRLIGKWLKVGVLEEGKRTLNEVGVPQVFLMAAGPHPVWVSIPAEYPLPYTSRFSIALPSPLYSLPNPLRTPYSLPYLYLLLPSGLAPCSSL